MTTRLLVGDARDRIAEIPDGTVDLVVTSPPFLALRKYGDNDAEMGSEGTPADFLDALLDLTLEFRRVLAPHGSIAIELGDTYSGSGGGGGDYLEGGWRDGQPGFAGSAQSQREGNAQHWRDKNAQKDAWPLAKSLALIPQLYPASLAYGRNLLNPAHTFTPWRVRNIITWCRPNPPVGALGDKVRPATSYITVACPSAKRWFDLDAVRTEGVEPGAVKHKRKNNAGANTNTGWASDNEFIHQNPAGAPPLDWWDDALDPNDPTDHMTLVMPTQPYPGAHYATWPAKLAQRLIDMMCPRQVCRTCGKPSERIVGETDYERARIPTGRPLESLGSGARGRLHGGGRPSADPPTHGWSDCGHNNFRPGHVLDPFAGSGTTLAVASGMGRDVTGIELYPANRELICERVGMFLETDDQPIIDLEPL